MSEAKLAAGDGIEGRPFYKMAGSGNDFVFFDVRTTPSGALETPEIIQRLCARGTGVGADGVVFLAPSSAADVAIRYYNADGSLAALCGNATLCTTTLAARLGGVHPSGFQIETDAGVVNARIRDGGPEFDLPAALEVAPLYAPIEREPGEHHLGFVITGVPHLVIQVDDVASVDVVGRGRPLRHHPSLAAGANVNFVSRRADGRWNIRTYERGVEDETLACGTGNAAAGVLLRQWSEADDRIELVTRSGKPVEVTLRHRHPDFWLPSLKGEGRIVFLGELGSI